MPGNKLGEPRLWVVSEFFKRRGRGQKGAPRLPIRSSRSDLDRRDTPGLAARQEPRGQPFPGLGPGGKLRERGSEEFFCPARRLVEERCGFGIWSGDPASQE